MKRKLLRFASYLAVAGLASALTLGVNWWLGDYSKLEQLESLIEQLYIEDVDLTTVEDYAAEGMIAALGDRWSYYIPASEYQSYQEQSENAYVGIGITIIQAEDGSGLEVVEVQPEGPAMEAGMQPGDLITAIFDQTAAGMTTEEARNLVRGEEGTFVSITVRREEQELNLSVKRARIETVVASGQLLDGNIGLVTISNFDQRCAQESIAAMEDLLNQGAEKLIFDVRFNPGGYADELVKLLDYLLPEGNLFQTVDSMGRETLDTSDEKWLDVPMAVLVNADSYSAAEFFAAALQEYEAAVIIGEQTSGKGYFQNTFPLVDGSAVALSTGKYFTPKGVSLEGVGITPDILSTVDEDTYWQIYYNQIPPEEDPQIAAAIAALNG